MIISYLPILGLADRCLEYVNIREYVELTGVPCSLPLDSVKMDHLNRTATLTLRIPGLSEDLNSLHPKQTHFLDMVQQ